MYEPLLLIHSTVRWVVLIAMICLLFRSIKGAFLKEQWTEFDDQLVWAFDQAFGYQILFGFTLWLAFSPMTKAVFKNPEALQSSPILMFWAVRHALTMLGAFGVWHMGKAWVKRAPLNSRFKKCAFTLAMVLALIASAIPWPGLMYGRPLVRLFL